MTELTALGDIRLLSKHAAVGAQDAGWLASLLRRAAVLTDAEIARISQIRAYVARGDRPAQEMRA